jgi:hypothetical protein
MVGWSEVHMRFVFYRDHAIQIVDLDRNTQHGHRCIRNEDRWSRKSMYILQSFGHGNRVFSSNHYVPRPTFP